MNHRLFTIAAIALVLAIGCNRTTPTANAPLPAAPVPPPPPPDFGKPDKDVPAAAADSQASEPLSASPAVPPREPGERFLLLTSGGPLVVEVSLTVDGQPLRVAREREVDKLLKMADSDDDGQATWKEAIEHPRFAALETAYSNPENDRERERQRKQYDRDSDGNMSRAEAEYFMGRIAGAGSSLSLDSSSYRGAVSDSSRLRELLDADGDATLSAAEWQAAPQRLKLYDVDDNDLISLQELAGNLPTEAMEMARTRAGEDDGPPRALILGLHANWEAIMYSFEDLYLYDGRLRPESFPLSPRLFAHLDLDDSRTLDRKELQRLNTAQPQLRIDVNFGRTGGLAKQPAVREVSAELAAAVRGFDAAKPASLELSGVKLQLASTDTTPGQDFEATAQQALAQIDTDKNSYIDSDEFDAAAEQRPEASFEDFDKDEDGKIYPAELTEYFAAQQQAPIAVRIQLTVRNQDDPFFGALDTSGDGRLSPREVAQALATMKSLDTDGDGQLTRGEIPATVSLSFERGERNAMAAGNRPATMAAAPAAEARGPKWFIAMDRNGDGDVGPAEFLGTPEQFARLDANRDGFLDADEALAHATPSP